MRGCVMAVAARALSAVASVAGATRSTVRQNVPISMIGKRRVAVVRGHLSCRARHVIASTSSSSRGSACGGFGSVSPAGLGGAASRGGASLSLGAPRADRRTDRGDSRGSIEAGAGASSSGGAAGGGPVDVGTSSSYPDYQPQVENYAGALACVPPDDASLTPGHVVLVDGMSVVFRAFYGLRNRADRLVNSKGEDVSVLFSVAHTVLGLLELQPTHMAVCFDAKGKTFRHEMFTDYKANRPPTPPELAEAIPAVTDMVQRMGIPLLMMSGVEADDIIGTVARRSVESGLHVSIMSPDKDFFQLLGPRVRQLRPNGKNFNPSRTLTNEEGGGDGFGSASHHNLNTKGLVPYTERDFRDEFMNLDPAQFVDLLAMVGDASDNVPGVEGIGAKTAPKLLAEFGNIEGVIANAAKVRNKRVRESLGSEKGAATAHLCRSLVKIRTRLNVPHFNDPALPIGALALKSGIVPPPDGGLAVGEFLERELELPTAAERWREVCYQYAAAAAAEGSDGG